MKFQCKILSRQFRSCWRKAGENIEISIFMVQRTVGKHLFSHPLSLYTRPFATRQRARVGAENAEIIILNDFRWKPSIIAWGDMLQLLEGDITHLPALKNFAKRDIELKKDTQVFATADAPIVLVKGGVVVVANTEVLKKISTFLAAIPPGEQLHLVPCEHCFAQLVFENIRG